MKNTLIPLDMLFLEADGRIVDLHERAVPYSLDVIASKAPARFAVELNGGTVARLGIKSATALPRPISQRIASLIVPPRRRTDAGAHGGEQLRARDRLH